MESVPRARGEKSGPVPEKSVGRVRLWFLRVILPKQVAGKRCVRAPIVEIASASLDFPT
jgi:hypothetical protein